MLRRDFFKGFGALALTAVAAPLLIAKAHTPDPIDRYMHDGGEKTLFVGENGWEQLKKEAMRMHMEEIEEAFLFGVKMTRYKSPHGYVNVIKHPMLAKVGA